MDDTAKSVEVELEAKAVPELRLDEGRSKEFDGLAALSTSDGEFFVASEDTLRAALASISG